MQSFVLTAFCLQFNDVERLHTVRECRSVWEGSVCFCCQNIKKKKEKVDLSFLRKHF